MTFTREIFSQPLFICTLESFHVRLIYNLVIIFMWWLCDVVTCETVVALNSIFQKWDANAVPLWNTTGDPCSGSAIDDGIEFEDPSNNPAIKCVCTYANRTTYHITKLYASLSLSLILGHEKRINSPC